MPHGRLTQGQVIDGFLIGEKLRDGGMANLWTVTRPDISIPVIMKIPEILDGYDATTIVGFEMEQMILPMLTGVHVPRLFAQGDFATQPYLVMEHIQGQSLYPLLERLPLPINEIIDLGANIAVALNDLHRQHVIHHDIKPSNIMRRHNGEVVLIDFGVSRHDFLPDLLAEEFHLPVGTGPYISPEQLLGVRSDPRSDIFALGVVLYYLTTGTRPFGVHWGRRALRRRLWRDPPPPCALRPDCPAALQEIILRCMESDAQKRYPTAAQLSFDLRHLDKITLTERAERLRQDSYAKAFHRWFNLMVKDPKPSKPIAESLSAAPIIMVAIDLSEEQESVADMLRVTVTQIMKTSPGVRLACVNVMKTNRLALNYALDEQGRNRHVQHLVSLKNWARPMGLTKELVSFHVLEGPDPARILLDYARLNHVDQIFVGARGRSALRRYLGSVSAQVVAEAPCTVTVVRIQDNARLDANHADPGHMTDDLESKPVRTDETS